MSTFCRISMMTTAVALGSLLAVGVARSDDMAGMDMSGSANSQTMAPNAMGSMKGMEHHMRMTALRAATPQRRSLPVT